VTGAQSPAIAPPACLEEATLAPRAADIGISLLACLASLAVLGAAVTPWGSLPVLISLHGASLLIPGAYFAMRLRHGGDLTIPFLLMVTTFACGPVGGLGCACLAASFGCWRPSPARLRAWYDYIAGVIARERIVRLYEELSAGRVPSNPTAEVPRFRPIMQGSSIETQQSVLGVIGRRYHADFRAVLRDALRNRNSFIRAQAAAVASRLDAQEKKRLWSVGQPDTAETGHARSVD
jgi:hypothetical protein